MLLHELQDPTNSLQLVEDEETEHTSSGVPPDLRVHDNMVYVFRDTGRNHVITNEQLVDVHDATTLEWQRRFKLERSKPKVPFKSQEASKLVHFIRNDRAGLYNGTSISAMTPTGQLVQMAQGGLVPRRSRAAGEKLYECDRELENALAVEVVEDRLYVLEQRDHMIGDDFEEQCELWLHALTLEGRPTQCPLMIEERFASGDAPMGFRDDYSLGASSDCVYISSKYHRTVKTVDIAGWE